jgi:hypothetical protein
MKRASTLFLLMICLLSVCTAQEVIMSPKYIDIEAGRNLQADFSQVKNQVQVIFPNKADAKAAVKALTVTTQGEDLTNLAARVNGKQLTGSQSAILLFDLKEKLPVTSFKLGFIKNNRLIGKLYTLTLRAAAPMAAAPPAATAAPPALQVVHYYPTPVGAGNKLPSFARPTEANMVNTSVTEVNPDNRNPKSSTNLTYVFSGKNFNSAYWDGNGKSYLRVGQKLSVILDPVPNPLRYNVKINNVFLNYNTETDSLLEKLLLNPWNLLGKNVTLAGTNGGRKKKALGYLQEVNSKLKEYMDAWQTIDGIDPIDFKSKKDGIRSAINNYLGSAADLNYPGDIPDFLVNEFDPSDSLYIKPFIKTYQAFLSFDVTQTRKQIVQTPNADEMIVNIQILPKAGIATALQTDTAVSLSIPIFGGFKVDVSPGIFYSFFGQNTYSLRADSSAAPGSSTAYQKFKTIVTEKQPGGSAGFSTLMHFYSRWTRDVNFALSIGAGITLGNSTQVRYLTGGSILFGRTNRIALSGGYSFGNVNMISGKYKDNRAENTDSSVDTYKTLKGAGFIALSYNIPILKRKSSK